MPDLFSILPEVQQAFNRVVPYVGVCGNQLGKRENNYCVRVTRGGALGLAPSFAKPMEGRIAPGYYLIVLSGLWLGCARAS